MQLKLGNVLAGLAARTFEEEHQRGIEKLLGLGVDDPAERRQPRLWAGWRHPVEHEARSRPGDTDDRNSRLAAPTR
jgi:hypothetical protein